MQRTRDNGARLDGICMGDGVLVAVFFEGHNEGIIALNVGEALELAREILASYCQTCEQRGEISDAGECADCARNRAQREEQA